jgi:hypothetical protein
MQWFQTAFEPESEVTEASLWKVPAEYQALSRNITVGLQKVYNGELGARVLFEIEQRVSKGESYPGLVLMRCTTKRYYTGTALEDMYNVNDLQRIKCHNGNLEAMQMMWIQVVAGLKTPQPDEVYQELCFDLVKDHPELKG